jgi:hypothetical protein
MLYRALALLVFATAASAASNPLGDADLIACAGAVMAVKEAPVDRILGLHKGAPVMVDVRCGDVCPQNTVRVIHYMVDPGPVCTKLGGDTANVMMPMGLTTRPQPFCIPHVLYARKMYTDRPYQK